MKKKKEKLQLQQQELRLHQDLDQGLHPDPDQGLHLDQGGLHLDLELYEGLFVEQHEQHERGLLNPEPEEGLPAPQHEQRHVHE